MSKKHERKTSVLVVEYNPGGVLGTDEDPITHLLNRMAERDLASCYHMADTGMVVTRAEIVSKKKIKKNIEEIVVRRSKAIV